MEMTVRHELGDDDQRDYPPLAVPITAVLGNGNDICPIRSATIFSLMIVVLAGFMDNNLQLGPHRFTTRFSAQLQTGPPINIYENDVDHSTSSYVTTVDVATQAEVAGVVHWCRFTVIAAVVSNDELSDERQRLTAFCPIHSCCRAAAQAPSYGRELWTRLLATDEKFATALLVTEMKNGLVSPLSEISARSLNIQQRP
ncbi:unnamed protein product [Soboliphyme baturini]|uniref:Uncharacterized protein n=1 Tax=Soboliphyme baturini TaxID=241478 RepID=A0A183IQM5_9BILA|nr:unnamed protein product [Soboliphyme baturini]